MLTWIYHLHLRRFFVSERKCLGEMKEEMNRYLIVRQKKEGIIFFVLK